MIIIIDKDYEDDVDDGNDNMIIRFVFNFEGEKYISISITLYIVCL